MSKGIFKKKYSRNFSKKVKRVMNNELETKYTW